MELQTYINLDYFLSVKYTRTVDVSNCISISGTTFVIKTKEILHKKKKYVFGLKSGFNDKWDKIIRLSDSNRKSLNSNDSDEAIIQKSIYLNCLKNERLSA